LGAQVKGHCFWHLAEFLYLLWKDEIFIWLYRKSLETF
jgi:hypothetical protein